MWIWSSASPSTGPPPQLNQTENPRFRHPPLATSHKAQVRLKSLSATSPLAMAHTDRESSVPPAPASHRPQASSHKSVTSPPKVTSHYQLKTSIPVIKHRVTPPKRATPDLLAGTVTLSLIQGPIQGRTTAS